MLKSTKQVNEDNINNNKLLDENASKLTNRWDLDQERSNMVLMIKERINKETYNKLTNYKRSAKMYEIKSKIE